ncbi:MAG: DUF3570 domain-containing protein [Planctomycetota bacterium]
MRLLLKLGLGLGPVLALVLGLATGARADEAVAPVGSPAAAQPAARPTTTAHLRFGYYEQKDGHGRDGNPFLDEHEQVLEPVLVVEQQVGKDSAWTLKLAHDYVSSASIARLDNYPTQSGASADYYAGVDLGARTKVGEQVGVAATAHGAFERDYRSAGGTAAVSWESEDKNTALSLSVTGYYDTVLRILYNGRNLGSAPRRTLNLDLQVYRVLTPWLHGEVGYSFTRQWGFLETALNSVVLEPPGASPNPLLIDSFPGVEVTEALPGLRLRHALRARARGLFGPIALELELRGYVDSWGVEAGEVSPRAFAWVVPDLLRLRLGYRYYRQSRARYFRERFPQETYHRTQDSDLAALDSHTLSAQLALYLGERWRLDLSCEYVWRSDDLDQIRTSAGIGARF